MTDATFEDGAERPIRLRAEDAGDLPVISTLLQDAVARVGDLVWMKKRRRFGLFVNRFRWEDRDRATRAGRPFERVRATLMVDDVLAVRANGINPADKEAVVSVLALEFAPGADGAGVLTVLCAGDGEIAIDVECLDVALEDLTRPWRAQSGAAPDHGA